MTMYCSNCGHMAPPALTGPCAACGGQSFRGEFYYVPPQVGTHFPFGQYAPPTGAAQPGCQPAKDLTEADVRRIVQEELQQHMRTSHGKF
jgi:hypothetical protein